MSLNNVFDRIVVINLPDRLDRRREMQEQLRRASVRAEFFPATRVKEAGDWPGCGARGCFMSHYRLLKDSLEQETRHLLVLEDDLDFSPLLKELEQELEVKIATSNWDLLYLGHVEPVSGEAEVELIPWHAPLMTAHFYAVNRRILPRLVEFMELVLSRPAGHPLGGPQHYDGALCMFRAQNPDVNTLIAVPNLGFQRSSRSDISSAWYDKLPVVGSLINTGRRLRRYTLSLVKS